MRDVPFDPDAESEYECFDCGTVVEATSHPGACPDCGTDLRNRHQPIE